MQPKKMKKSSESICRLKNCKAFVPRDLQVPLDSITDICHFFTRAKFLENKIYTEKTRKSFGRLLQKKVFEKKSKKYLRM